MRLRPTLEAELDRPAPDAVLAVAAAVLADHGDAVAAILFYGSCRRTGDVAGLIDLAVLHDGHLAYHRHALPALFNALLPPQVMLIETLCAGLPVRAKIAIYARRQFRRRMRQGSLDTTVWARFCQPASLLHVRDAEARRWVTDTIAEGIDTASIWANRLMRPGEISWTRLFTRTYDAELRPEPARRAAMIYEDNRAWFDTILAPARVASPAGPWTRRLWALSWAARVATGKTLNVLRLIKAAFTFAGGADYIAWKIERHAGIRLELSDWQRRHPLLAVPSVLLRLRRGGRG